MFATRAFNEPEKYQGPAISLADDQLTFEQGKEAFREVLGYEIPETFGVVGAGVKDVE